MDKWAARTFGRRSEKWQEQKLGKQGNRQQVSPYLYQSLATKLWTKATVFLLRCPDDPDELCPVSVNAVLGAL